MSDIFLIPSGNELGLKENDQVYVLYSPLEEGVALVSKSDAESILAYVDNPDKVQPNEAVELYREMVPRRLPSVADLVPLEKTTKLSILPNLTCNFTCSYCYSANGRSRQKLDFDTVKSVLEYFIDENRLEPQPLSIFVSGGGEPLLSWDVLEQALKFARARAEGKGFPLYMSIVTNGSLLTGSIVDSLKALDCAVCISFEVLEDLQNCQRNHYAQVCSNIELLRRAGIRTMLNSTITPASVSRMVEMIGEIADKYSFIAQYTMEPVTGYEMFSTPEDMEGFYNSFYDGYLKCKDIARKKGINLRFTFDDSLRGITIRHCPGKFTLTPQGTISACHLTSSPKEKRYARCVYGNVSSSGKVELDFEKFKQIRDINVFSYERCTDCFAKWSCGGECMARNDTYPGEFMAKVCDFNRRFVHHLLIEELRNTVYEETGLTLEEYVNE